MSEFTYIGSLVSAGGGMVAELKDMFGEGAKIFELWLFAKQRNDI